MKPIRHVGGIAYEGEEEMKTTDQIPAKDFAAPEAAFEKYADMVYRLAFVRTKNRHDSDDVLQEVFLRYMRVWETMESEQHVKAMLIRIAINCSNSLLSSVWFKRTEPLDENIASESSVPTEDALGAVLKLPLKYRTVIHLFYYMGYSVNEIAEMTKTNPSTVKTRLSRGRERLKNTLKADDL